MSDDAAGLGSGKGHHDENFPVASFLIAARHRDVVLAFYRFARAADDIADHPQLSADEKLRTLDTMRRTVLGETDGEAQALALRRAMSSRGLTVQHAIDLLEAFRRDVTKLRYRDWDDLMEYCRYSAMPVGRFVLDVHGEAHSTWPASDALCAALQIINHLQDCAKDYRALDRVYIPLDAFAAAGIGPESLSAERGSPALLSVIRNLTARTKTLLAASRMFPSQVSDGRLALEVSVIQNLAEDLCAKLERRDPLSEPVHHGKSEAAGLALLTAAKFLPGRLLRRPSKTAPAS